MLQQIIEFFKRLFDTGGWPARWHCGTWTEFHGWIYIISNLGIGTAYFIISFILIRIIRKKRGSTFSPILLLFSLFILFCGLSHVMDAVIFWWPAYRLNALILFLTGFISWLTVFACILYLPKVLSLKTSMQFELELKKRREVEVSLIKAKELAESSAKVKEQFLANMSHEIRTPMNAIIGFTGLLEEATLTEHQKSWLTAIKASSENLLVIVNDILDFAKIEAGKVVFEQNRISITDLIHSSVTMLQSKAVEKNIDLYFTNDTKMPSVVLGDSVRLTQILLNLFSNAVKFTDRGHVKVEVAIVAESAEDITVQFSVTDSGIGIQENQIGSIFESFTQGSNNSGLKYEGTGLGLSIAKKLIEQQGGVLTVQSVAQEGSCFSFTLPFKKALADEERTPDAPTELDVERVAHLHILVVEDNALSQMLVKTVLERWKVQVDVANNGLAALEMLRLHTYHLVLMDIQMPEMDGYETVRQIRAGKDAAVPVIAMTAHAFKSEMDKCLRAGMNDYISKPFYPEDLLRKIIALTRVAE